MKRTLRFVAAAIALFCVVSYAGDDNEEVAQTLTEEVAQILTNLGEKFTAAVSFCDVLYAGDDTEEVAQTLTELGKTFTAVDLGLSVKWASFNLGATAPEMYGSYYQWGDPEAKSSKTYDWKSYKYCNGDYKTITKYCNDSEYGAYGFTDELITLTKEDDAVAVALGGSWRMPTNAEWDELNSNCTWVWTTQNGVAGYKVTSNGEGYTDKWIFLPASGCWDDSSFYGQGVYGDYWNASLNESNPSRARFFSFYDGFHETSVHTREDGFSVRPVAEY